MTRPVLAALALLALTGRAVAGPADALVRMVPPGASLGLVVQNLRSHVHAVAGSPFAEWVSGSPAVRRVQGGPEAGKLQAVVGFVTAQFGVTPVEVLDDVFGDAVVLAYLPGPPGEPTKEAGLMLVKPRRPEVLARIIGKLNELQTASGELKAVRERTHRGVTYSAREKANGDAEFFAERDGVFLLSGQERAVRAVIDHVHAGGDKPSAMAAGVGRLGLADKAVVGWLDPRAFDAELATKEGATKDPGERAFLAAFRRGWAAVDAVGVYAHPGRGLEFGGSLAVRREDLPAEVVAVLTPSAGGSAAWAAVPADAMAAVGGRIDVPKMLDAIGAFLPADGRDGLKATVARVLGPVFGRDKLAGVLRGIGPDWAAWATAPADGEGWLPQGAVVVRLADADVTRAVSQALDLGFQLLRIQYNQSHPDQVEFGDEARDGVTVKFLANEAGFPPGLRPCHAVKGGYLILATSPGVVARFTPPAVDAKVDAPLMRVSAEKLRDYLTRHREAVAAALAGGQHRSPADVAKELAGLADGLAALDKVEVRYDAADGRATLSLTLETVKPLR